VCLVDDVDEEMGREGGRGSWGNFLLEFFGQGTHLTLLLLPSVSHGSHHSWYQLGFPNGPFFL
jgi:hypothetical protein